MRIFTIAMLAVLSQVNWSTYGFTYQNTRYVPGLQINRSNVGRISPVWHFDMGPHEHVETTPIVVGTTMYVTEGVGNNVIALDAATGKQKWRYRPSISFMSPCCGAINRGIAIEGRRVFVATLDAKLIALDARSGRTLWTQRIGNPADGLSETMAPLAWDGRVFIGSSGSDFGVRGSFSAYRASDGKLLWRWYAVSPGWEGTYASAAQGVSLNRDLAREKKDAAKLEYAWKRGGGAVWMTPALDATTGTLFFTTSNPYPVFSAAQRPGDNLYTECIVALDARTGKMRWYYQQTPHDVWEYESSSPPVLFDASDTHARSIPAVGEAGKNRWFYELRRDNGKTIRLTAYAPNRGLYDAPSSDRDKLPFRGNLGPVSYDARHHFAFVAAIEQRRAETPQAAWLDFIAAVNVNTGRIAWKRTLSDWRQGTFGDHMVPGSVSTEELVFVPEPQGEFYALDAGNGAILWHGRLGERADFARNTGVLQRLAYRIHDWLEPVKRALFHQDPAPNAAASVTGSPIIYQVAGKEYVAIGFDAAPDSAAGGAEIYAFALRSE